MPHRRSKLKLELRRMWRESYRDAEKAETVALKDYPLLAIGRGEVLISARYVNPSLSISE